MPEFNNNMQQVMMEQAAPQFSGQTEWGELDPEIYGNGARGSYGGC